MKRRQLNWKIRVGVVFAAFHLLLYGITMAFVSRQLPLHPQLLYLMAFLDNPVITLFDFLQIRLGWISRSYPLSDFLFVFGTVFYFFLGLLTALIYQRITPNDNEPGSPDESALPVETADPKELE